MISLQNCEIFASLLFFLLSKLLCYFHDWSFVPMYNKRQNLLDSIPEKNEIEEDTKTTKWVPKKKHEVLKAKYKCLKKLFQIYDASVIGILPESFPEESYVEESRTHHERRKRRSRRTKTDACAGTTEHGDGSECSVGDNKSSTVATALIRDLKIQCSSSTQWMSETRKDEDSVEKTTQDSRDSLSHITQSEKECEFTQTSQTQHPIPYLMFNEKRKLTRFQNFIHRLLGIRTEKTYKNYVLPNGHICAASDNDIIGFGERRRRRGLRFRRIRRAKKIKSETALRDLRSPMILNCIQSVQKSCLIDTTPRQCPIVGCRMLLYGIITYNDHLNLCHFKERRYACLYCHEGFEQEFEKYVHENEHIGITKFPNINNYSASTVRQSTQKASNTQTDPETRSDVREEKLKKIVSFFDKIADTEQILTEIKKHRYSESNLHMLQRPSNTDFEGVTDNSESNSSSDKRTVSCGNLLHRKMKCMVKSDATSKCPSTSVKCSFCGENFDYRRQLSLHVDLEHRVYDKFSKFHSCTGISNRTDMHSEAGKIAVRSTRRDIRRVNTSSSLNQDSYSEVSRRKSEESLSCDPSTNIIYYESFDCVKRPSRINNIVQKVRSGITNYKWEPGTKIIRV